MSDDTAGKPRAYKGFTPRMGIYAVRHLPSGRMILDASRHLDGSLNRHRFQLNAGMHAEKSLQADWRNDGPDAFVFEILDELAPLETDRDPADDLAELLSLWRERCGRSADQGYAE